MFLFLQFSHLKLQKVSVYIILLDFQCFGPHCSKYFPLSCTVHLRLPSLIGCLSDLSCGGERSLSLYKAAVWAVLLSSDHHLPRPLLWTWFCALVPCEVTDGYTQTVTYKWLTALFHLMQWLVLFRMDMSMFWWYYKPEMCLSFTVYIQVISPSWSLLWSWRARWPCG